MTKVLIADDHELIRNGIKDMLLTSEEFKLVGEAEDGQEAIELSKKYSPDILIMDIAMPNVSGLEATETIKAEFPDIKILILTMHEDEEYIIRMYEAGASGYILKNAKMPELLDAIKTIAKGDFYFNNEVTQIMLKGMQEKNRESAKPSSFEKDASVLTDREIEIVKLIADGLSNKEIAEHLFISVRTVETHRKNLMKKIKVKNTAEIIKFAIHYELVKY